MLKGLVEVHRLIRYKILATDRVQEGAGSLISSTLLEDLGLEVQVFDSGRVVVKGPRECWEYDLHTGAFECRPQEVNEEEGEVPQ